MRLSCDRVSLVLKLAVGLAVALSVADVAAQWPLREDAGVPRDAKGNVRMDAPTPRTADKRPDFSGVWMRAESGPPPKEGRGGGGGIDIPVERFPYDPNGPPVATFFEAGGNMTGGLPYTPWAAELRKKRLAANARDNPDAMCLPMGFLQFHQQPQPRMIVQTPKMVLIEYEANSGIRHIYLDGRTLPRQGDPQPWWYGYSVGRWEGDTLVVEPNNLRGAEDGPHDGWLDVNGSPHSRDARMIERIRRPTFGHLQIDFTIEDPKSYTKAWTVRVDQRILPGHELIEAICNENQQFRQRIKID